MRSPSRQKAVWREAAALAFLCAAVLAVLLATGFPGAAPGGQATGQIRLAFSPPDVVRNVVLFTPLGVSLAFLGWRRGRSFAAGAALSAAVEAVQWVIPGRETSPWDVLANTIGVALGHLLVHEWRDLLVPPNPTAAARLYRCASLAAASALLGGSLLFAPHLPPAPYFGHLAPDLPRLVPYQGRILRVEVAGHPLPNGEIPSAGRLRRLLGEDHRVRISATAAPETRRLSALTLVTDRDDRGVLIVGERRGELFYSALTWAHVLGFEGGGRWVPEVFKGNDPGSPLAVEVQRKARDLCIGVNGPPVCGLGFRASESWMHWLPVGGVHPALRPWLGVLWLGGMFALVGFYGRDRLRDPLPWLLILGALLTIVLWAPTLPPSHDEWALILCGFSLGFVARGLLPRAAPGTETRA